MFTGLHAHPQTSFNWFKNLFGKGNACEEKCDDILEQETKICADKGTQVAACKSRALDFAKHCESKCSQVVADGTTLFLLSTRMRAAILSGFL